jgi:hypothetical protein
MSERTIE